MTILRPRTGFCSRSLIVVVVLLLATAAGARADDDSGWRLRVDFGFFDPGGDGITIDTGTTTVQTDLDGGAGAGVRGEYQLSRRLGVEFGFFSGGSVDVDIGVSGSSSTTSVEVSSFVPLTVGLDVHLTPQARVDLYVGPQLAWVSYSNVNVGTPSFTSVSVDADLGWAAVLGLDIPMGQRKRWMFQMNLRYFDTKMQGSTSSAQLGADFDPTVFSLGFGYRF